MKQLGNEEYMNPQSSLDESYGPSRALGGGGEGVAAGCGKKLTTTDALKYLKQVKDKFQDETEKYDTFFAIMKDFKARRIDSAGVVVRVKELFKGHPELILGFNTFLPKGYEITRTDEEEAPPKRRVEFEEALSFVNKIKKRFQNKDYVYKSFVGILYMSRKENKQIDEIYQEMAELFSDHPDLLDEFTRFLPDTSAPHTSFGHRSSHHYDNTMSALRTIRQYHIDKQRPRRDMVIDPNGERDLSVERPDMDGDKTAMKLHEEPEKHIEKEIRDLRNCDQDDRHPDTKNNGDISMHRLSEKWKSSRKVEDFGGNSNLASYDNKDAWKRMYRHAFTFHDKIKERLRSAEEHCSSHCLHHGSCSFMEACIGNDSRATRNHN